MENLNDRIREVFTASANLKLQLASDPAFVNLLRETAARMAAALRQGNKVLFCGNGGSAADAQHIAAELSGRFYSDRDPLPAEALHVNTSYLTAVANDYGYEQVYSRMVRAQGREGDMLVGISTSGNSRNVVLALEEARNRGMVTVSFTGAGGGKMGELSDFLFAVPSKDTPRIQEVHILIGHTLCELVEKELFPGA